MAKPARSQTAPVANKADKRSAGGVTKTFTYTVSPGGKAPKLPKV